MRSMIRSSFFIDSIPVFVFLLIVPPPAASIIPQRTPRVNGAANSDRKHADLNRTPSRGQ